MVENDPTKPASIEPNGTLLWLVAASLYFILAAATVHLTSDGRSIASIWPANAVLLALLMTSANPRPGVVLSAGFVANVVANQITRGSVIGPALYGMGNIFEVWLATTLLTRARITRDTEILNSAISVGRFVIVAGMIAPVLSGALGSLTARVFFNEPLGVSFTNWVLSDGLGLLIFTPLFAALFRGDFAACYLRKTWPDRFTGLALVMLTIAITLYVFYLASTPMLFAVYPPMMMLTFKVGRLGTKVGVVLVAVIGGIATMSGHGPIAVIGSDAANQAHLFQAFLAVLLLTCLPVAAEVTKRARLAAQIAEHDKEMSRRALTDTLTGALNRAGFVERANRELAGGDRRDVSLIAIDVDHFKSINDQWGHLAGDTALQHLAVCLQAHLRQGDVVGRLGGDEFALLLPGSDMAAARTIGERVRDAIRRSPLTMDDRTSVLLSLSMGVVSANTGETYPDLARRADEALYAAKRGGRDAIRHAG